MVVWLAVSVFRSRLSSVCAGVPTMRTTSMPRWPQVTFQNRGAEQGSAKSGRSEQQQKPSECDRGMEMVRKNCNGYGCALEFGEVSGAILQ